MDKSALKPCPFDEFYNDSALENDNEQFHDLVLLHMGRLQASVLDTWLKQAFEAGRNTRTPIEVKPLVIHELRYGYWDAGYGYQIAHNVDDYYRIRCHGKVICKKIKGWGRAVAWLQAHHDAIIKGATL